MDLEIKEEDGFGWRFTGMYGEPRAEKKYLTWKLLRILHNEASLPWLCLGDFNEVLFANEKEEGNEKSQACMERFREALDFCGLEDLGFEGDKFTWRNNNHRWENYIQQRLDRAVANEGWRSGFGSFRVVNGDPRHSDHRPIIITMEEAGGERSREEEARGKGCGRHNFKFEARWLEEQQCDQLVKEAWRQAMDDGGLCVKDGLNRVAGKLMCWSENTLGSLEKRVKKAKREVERWRRMPVSKEKVAGEEVARYRLERLEDQVNTYWKQRAHTDWLMKGDKNTSFFHARTKERRRINRIGILFKANKESAMQIQRILQMYEASSGQTINKDKSAAFFSGNVKAEDKKDVMSIPGITKEAMNERYLGMPIHVGKELLIKVVAQTIPTFTMSCFDLTKSICEEISTAVCKYWWSQQDKTNKIHWLSWEKLTKSKGDGGLGFRDIYNFNMAMLARQGWRMPQNPESLCARVLGAKYFPDGNVLNAREISNMSYTWRSILKGIVILKKGLIWRVGNGQSINIWMDPWIPRGTTRLPATPRGTNLLSKVSDLIDPVTGGWDEPLVRATFHEDDTSWILAIPISNVLEDLRA
ncbi:uncharacterized protein [Aegilops tauschii subsp. strangulata]|uniref:uncharacterized protein n=1 Tax=Aegilops tauschii subsp. strangulata TaxID=200361 RepID=UPI003CC87E61